MAYRIEYRPAALRDLRGLNRQTQARVVEKIESLKDNPRPPGVKKLRGNEELYRVRVGNFRIIYEISDAAELVTIARISDRKDAY